MDNQLYAYKRASLNCYQRPNFNDGLAKYPQTSNISHTLVGNKIIHHLDVIGGSPVGATSTNRHSRINTWLQWTEQGQLEDNARNI